MKNLKSGLVNLLLVLLNPCLAYFLLDQTLQSKGHSYRASANLQRHVDKPGHSLDHKTVPRQQRRGLRRLPLSVHLQTLAERRDIRKGRGFQGSEENHGFAALHLFDFPQAGFFAGAPHFKKSVELGWSGCHQSFLFEV